MHHVISSSRKEAQDKSETSQPQAHQQFKSLQFNILSADLWSAVGGGRAPSYAAFHFADSGNTKCPRTWNLIYRCDLL